MESISTEIPLWKREQNEVAAEAGLINSGRQGELQQTGLSHMGIISVQSCGLIPEFCLSQLGRRQYE